VSLPSLPLAFAAERRYVGRTATATLHSMGSFVALHIRARDTDSLVVPIGHWLAPRLRCRGALGLRSAFAPDLRDPRGCRWSRAIERGLECPSLERLQPGRSIPRRGRGPPLGRTRGLPCGVVTGQTTSDVYQLVVLDGSTRVRVVTVSDGECLTNEGQRLPGERAGAFSMSTANGGADDDLPSPLQDAAAICSAMGFELWPASPSPGAVHVWRRRGLFSRLLGK
jgi:hypothetical protein